MGMTDRRHFQLGVITITPMVKLFAGGVLGKMAIHSKACNRGITVICLDAFVKCLFQMLYIIQNAAGGWFAYISETVAANTYLQFLLKSVLQIKFLAITNIFICCLSHVADFQYLIILQLQTFLRRFTIFALVYLRIFCKFAEIF